MRARHAHRTLAMLVLTTVVGCQSSGRATNATRLDRLMQAYPELNTGKFAIVADFEDESHMELVTLRATTPAAKFAYDQSHGRRQTGPACVKVSATSAADTVIISNRTSSTWYLRGDWRAYDTMIVSVHAPHGGLTADVIIRSGADHRQATAPTTHPLNEGWNVLRVDLAEIAERIAIDQIQDIQLSFPGVTQKTDLYIDDLLLATDRSMVFGDNTTTGTTPYVQRIGGRLHVGTPGHFELTFAQGQIVNWFDLHNDPHRLHNLTRDTTLGPRVVVVDPTLQTAGEFTALGRAVITEQRLLEANAVRMVVDSVWRFVDDPRQPADGSPTHRRRYTIYPTGHVFVLVQADVSNDSWHPNQVGLSVRMAPPANDSISASLPTGRDDASHHPYGSLGCGAQPSRLLLATHTQGEPQWVTQLDPPTGVRSLVLVDEPTTTSRTWQCLLWLTTFDKTFEEQGAIQAAAFLDPPRLTLDAEPNDEGDSEHYTEFDRPTGSYILHPRGGRVGVTLRPGSPRIVNPAFTVSGTAGRDAWVYVDDVLHEPVARDAGGDLVFQLREAPRRTTRVEVIVRRGLAEPGS